MVAETIAKFAVLSSWVAANVYIRKDFFNLRLYDPEDLVPKCPVSKEKQAKLDQLHKRTTKSQKIKQVIKPGFVQPGSVVQYQ